MYGYIWLAAIILFTVLELLTFQLVSIWFVGGAIAGFIAYLCGAAFDIQMYIFIGTTIVLLLATRPLIKKKFKSGAYEKTNSDQLIGCQAIVTETIDNNQNTGAVKINGLPWTARSLDQTVIEKDSMVTVHKIEGVKLLVSKQDG